MLYGPHGYRTFPHSRCQEVPTVDVDLEKVKYIDEPCTQFITKKLKNINVIKKELTIADFNVVFR